MTIDHVTAASADLKTAQARLAALGIRSEYGGPHNNHATEMALTSFPDGSYLELIAIQPKPDPQAVEAHYWSKHMRGNAGPAAWAIRSNDVAPEVARLKTTGTAATSPIRAGRDRPDGVRLDWETANVGKEPNGTFFPFMIRDFTPREQRVFPSGKPTTADFSGVVKVVIAVRDIKAAAERYQRAYGLAAPASQSDAAFGASLASFAGTPVILAAPLNAQSWVAARLEQFGDGPCAFILGGQKGAYQSATKSRWFGAEISWFDPAKLGWHLGFEK